MSLAQDRLLIAAIVLTESAWLYAAFGVMGVAFGQGKSPLGWLAVLAIMISSALTTRVLRLIIMPTITAYAFQMAIGVMVLFLTMGTQFTSSGLDLGWIGIAISDPRPEGFIYTAAIGSIVAVGLWWRAGRLASSDEPLEILGISFRIGIVILAFAAIIDIFNSANLNVFRLMFLFFGSSLVGLSVGHLLPASRTTSEERTWFRVIGGVVSAIIAVGLIFSLLQENVLSIIAKPLLVVLNALATVIFFVFIVPLAYLAELITRGIINLFLRFSNERDMELIDPAFGFGQAFEELQAPDRGPLAAALLNALEWIVLAAIILVALYFLAKAFRRRGRWRSLLGEGVRESVREDADPASDLARLLFNLVPNRFRRAKKRKSLKLPDDDPDTIDVFRVYFGLITLAEDKGFPRRPAETPTEYQRTLEDIFPRDLVRRATAAFNRACYGHLPASRDQIEDMKVSLNRLSSGS